MLRWLRFRWRRILLWSAAIGAGLWFFTEYRGGPELAPVGVAASRVTDAWVDAVHEQAQDGYWLVVRGTHIGDQVVAAGSGASLTHVAVFDAERDEIIEAVGKGVGRAPLRELLAQAHRLVIVRPRDYSDEAGRAAVEIARARIGYAYDFLGTVGLGDDRRFYCSELALHVYRARERGWMPRGVIHPEHMSRYGDVIFDSGERTRDTAIAQLDQRLRDRFARMVDDARGVDYAAEVAPGLLRGGAPDSDGVAWLRARGVRTVINLRHYHGDSEGELVRAAGMSYVRIPLASTDAPTPQQVADFMRVVTDERKRPIYMHCLHGVDRTGAMAAVYRMEAQGWSATEALAEMEHFGAHGLLHDLRRFVGAYTPRGLGDSHEAP